MPVLKSLSFTAIPKDTNDPVHIQTGGAEATPSRPWLRPDSSPDLVED